MVGSNRPMQMTGVVTPGRENDSEWESAAPPRRTLDGSLPATTVPPGHGFVSKEPIDVRKYCAASPKLRNGCSSCAAVGQVVAACAVPAGAASATRARREQVRRRRELIRSAGPGAHPTHVDSGVQARHRLA